MDIHIGPMGFEDGLARGTGVPLVNAGDNRLSAYGMRPVCQ